MNDSRPKNRARNESGIHFASNPFPLKIRGVTGCPSAHFRKRDGKQKKWSKRAQIADMTSLHPKVCHDTGENFQTLFFVFLSTILYMVHILFTKTHSFENDSSSREVIPDQ